MAEPKKQESSLYTKDHYKEVLYLLAALLLISLLLQRLVASFNEAGIVSFGGLWADILTWFHGFWSFQKSFALGVTGISIALAAYSAQKLRAIEVAEALVYGAPVTDTFLEQSSELTKEENQRWLKVLELTNSTNPSDWRLAIIEADVMLDELLRANGYPGDGVGEMLKAVEPSDMLTLDAAWEAHKVRNRIAHAGADFQLNERETKRVIALFESVFREYEII